MLDLAIWFQHLASHKVPIFWRLHQVHHADRDIDVTTAVRFHPVEIALSMLWKIAVVVPLGAAPFAVFLFEVILNACAMFNHANIALPAWLDRVLRLFIVTPDMHRVHHSVLRSEHDRNFGFNLSLWDRLFGTYLAEPEGRAAGHDHRPAALSDRGTDAVRLEPVVALCEQKPETESQTRSRQPKSWLSAALEEAHGEIAQEQPFVAARGVHLLERVVQDLDELAVALLHGDADALAEKFRIEVGSAAELAAAFAGHAVEPEGEADAVAEDEIDGRRPSAPTALPRRFRTPRLLRRENTA